MNERAQALAGTLALFAATVAVLFGVALTTEDEGTGSLGADSVADASLDSEELLDLSLEVAPAVARRVEEIRGLEFGSIPEPQVTDVEELRAKAEKAIGKPKAAEELAAGDAGLKLLGLLEPEQSLAEAATEATAGAAAYYDPKEKELFLLGDAVPAGTAVTEFVLAHELGHALEDHAFGLPKSKASSDDRILAESALVEGSATALMSEYAAKHLAVTDLLSETGALESGAGDLPEIARAQVSFTYFGGGRFVDVLRANADDGWDLIDFAYQRRLPASTEQILHPEKYLEDEGPLAVPAAPDPGTGWEQVDASTVGEFFTREILRLGAVDAAADDAAAGWGGDRYVLYRRKGASRECEAACREDYALVIVWRGDDTGEARELRAGVEVFVEGGLEGSSAGAGAWELDGGWAATGGTRDIVTLALAPTDALAERLARPAAAAN